MSMSSAAIREAFLEFFRSKGHEIVESSSLIPTNDPTLLFTNAGMNQFKDTFLGAETRNYTKATTAQRCVRAGGKHNDLENVGYTARHHTFFEMLGNFSFGDYFKEEAISHAWELLTEVFKLPKDKLLVTVYATDDEAYDIWLNKMNVPADRIVRIGDNKGAAYASDNFWQMGDTGPCGPCTEIFYDHGEHIWGGPPGSPEEDGDRFIEIWNLVFMQFNRQKDGSMEPLPKPSVDTGMGLERIAAILQGVHSNYEIDTFQTLIKHAAKILQVEDLDNKSLRVLADHIRSCAFLIADGVQPSNEGRGYVLRRIIRRAVRHGHKLGARNAFFFRLTAKLAELMGAAYDHLAQQAPVIEKILQAEEEQFFRTIENGLSLLEQALAEVEGKELCGETVFKLYDTYGFPADLTADIAREREITIDQAGFDAAMAQQRKRSQQASSFDVDYNQAIRVDQASEFVGYDRVNENATVTAIFKDGVAVEQLVDGEEGLVVLDNTPFYAESGGQVGDTGELMMDDGAFVVQDTQKAGDAIVHKGYVSHGEIHVGEQLTADVDSLRRQNIALNHSATHLLHAALRDMLGDHVTQKGSLVDGEKLRFDFSHFNPVDVEQLRQLEVRVNNAIRANHHVSTDLMDIESAKRAGAMALFGEKYDEAVRVVAMGDASKELCGGTHVERTGDIGMFKIVSEGGVAAGVRRIEAVTGSTAIDMMHEVGRQLGEAAGILKSDTRNLNERLKSVIEHGKWLEREVERLNAKLSSAAGASLVDDALTIGDVKVIAAQLEGVEPKALRDTMDQLKSKLDKGIILLSAVKGDKISLIAGVTKNMTSQVKAGELVNMVAQQVGGKGGGRPDMAQAGGSDISALPAAVASVANWVESKLAG